MPPLTPSRKRLSLCEKQKIIEGSKKPGFDKNKTKITDSFKIDQLILK